MPEPVKVPVEAGQTHGGQTSQQLIAERQGALCWQHCMCISMFALKQRAPPCMLDCWTMYSLIQLPGPTNGASVHCGTAACSPEHGDSAANLTVLVTVAAVPTHIQDLYVSGRWDGIKETAVSVPPKTAPDAVTTQDQLGLPAKLGALTVACCIVAELAGGCSGEPSLPMPSTGIHWLGGRSGSWIGASICQNLRQGWYELMTHVIPSWQQVA